MVKHLCILLFLFTSVSLSWSQNDVPDVTSTFAITNANIIIKPGQVIKEATIVIKDGLIHQVGKNVSIPIDAEIIAGDSMFVYAGFIAAASHAGIPSKEEKRQGRPDGVKVSDPPNDVAGITPQKSIREVVRLTDGSIAAMRKEGFTLSHTLPKGRMMAGRGSIILLDGKSVDDMIIAEDVSMSGSLKSAPRIYPGTTIGVLAKWRQLYKQADLAKDHEKKYKMAPTGMKRPSFSKEIKSLYQVVSQDIPVFFSAPKQMDLHRAMQLQQELGFKMVATDIEQGWKLIPRLKSSGTAVILAMNLPKGAIKKDKKKDKKKGDKKDKDTDENKKDADKKNETDKKDEEMSEDRKAQKERIKKSKADYVAQASAFEKAGIPFAFSLTKVKSSDIKKNLLAMIEAGLSEDAALAALTTHPAKILGISSMAGSLENGKMANLIVTDTSYFKEKANIKYVFVDGEKHEMEVKKKDKKKSDGDASSDMAGTWNYVVDVPGDSPVEGTLKLMSSDETYTAEITMDNEDEPLGISEVEVDGSNVSFSFTTTIDGQSMPISMSIDISDDEFDGTVSIAGGMMTAPITGTKIPN